MKQLIVDCEHAVFPFGKYCPCCLEDVEATRDTKKLKPCLMKQCPKFKMKEK